MIAPSDAHLVRQTLQGDRAAFDEIIRRHQEHLYWVALRILQHEQDSQDALQDSLWLAFSRLRSLQQQTKLVQWLYWITRRIAISRLRQRKPRLSLDALMSDHGLDPQDSLPRPDEALHQNQCCRGLHAALERLSPAHRVVVQLYLDGNLYREIAERLEIPLGTVRSRMNRARVHLRDELAKYFPDSPSALKRAVPP